MDNTFEFLCDQYSKMKEHGMSHNDIKNNYDARIVKSAWGVFGRFYKSKKILLSESSYMLLLWSYSIFILNKKIEPVNTLSLDILNDIDAEMDKWTFSEPKYFSAVTTESKRNIIWMLNKFSDIQISGHPFYVN